MRAHFDSENRPITEFHQDSRLMMIGKFAVKSDMCDYDYTDQSLNIIRVVLI